MFPINTYDDENVDTFTHVGFDFKQNSNDRLSIDTKIKLVENETY